MGVDPTRWRATGLPARPSPLRLPRRRPRRRGHRPLATLLCRPCPDASTHPDPVLCPTEKSKDRGSNTIGARLNRVEDKVGARPGPRWP